MSRTACRSCRSLSWSAFRAGSLQSVWMGPSEHSFSGAVLRFSFARPACAAAFARRWAARVGVSLAVRRDPGGLVSVSVPIAPPHTRWPGSGRVVVVAGGLRAFIRELSASGIARWS